MEQRTVIAGDDHLLLTLTEFDLLSYLGANANTTVAHRELAQAVSGRAHEDEQECLRVLPTPTKARAQPDSLPFAYPISGLSIHLSEFPFRFETPAGGYLT